MFLGLVLRSKKYKLCVNQLYYFGRLFTPQHLAKNVAESNRNFFEIWWVF